MFPVLGRETVRRNGSKGAANMVCPRGSAWRDGLRAAGFRSLLGLLVAAGMMSSPRARAQDVQAGAFAETIADRVPLPEPTEAKSSPDAAAAPGTEPVQGGSAPGSQTTEALAEALADDNDLWTRRTLTGDWAGLRPYLRESGFTFAARETQFAFGIAGGITRPVQIPLPLPGGFGLGNVFKYTGRGEYDVILDLEKLVGLPKGSLLIRLENWYGEFGNVSLRAGTFAPPVFPAMLPPRPNQPGVPFVTNFLWTQPLSQRLVVFAGKKDILGSFDQDIFAGGDGTDQFVNQALIANPAFLLGLPYSSFTAGFVSPQQWGRISGFVLDATDRTADFFRMNNLFSRGIIVGGEVKVSTNFFDLPGQQHLGGMWKHIPLTNLRFEEPPPGVFPEPTVPGFPTIQDSYTLYYGFDQYLAQFPGSDRGWGLFGRGSISDGNPTPVRYFLSAGFGGHSPFGRERGDTFGIGWYLVGASNEFGPIPRAIFGPRNGTGVELYYNFQVTPWLNVTPDFQIIRPGAGAISTDAAFTYGLRVNASF